MKTNQVLSLVLIVFMTSTLAMSTSSAAVDETKLADPSRHLVYDASMYFEWDYNKTAAEESLSGMGRISGFLPLVNAEKNESGNMANNQLYVAEGDISDMNITAGATYSSDLWADIDTPADDPALTRSSNGQKIAQIDESTMASFDDEIEMQYNIKETSSDLNDFEDTIANRVSRGWDRNSIDLALAEVQIKLNMDVLDNIMEAIFASASYTETETMSTEDLDLIIENVFPEFFRGVNFGVANKTLVAAAVDEEHEPTDEIVATIGNKTDHALAGFSSSAFIGNALVGYILENWDALTGALAIGQFGAIQTTGDFGLLHGLTLGEEEDGTITAELGFNTLSLVSAINGTAVNIGTGLSVLLTDWMNFELFAEPEANYTFAAFLLALILYIVLVFGFASGSLKERTDKVMQVVLPKDGIKMIGKGGSNALGGFLMILLWAVYTSVILWFMTSLILALAF